MNHALAQRFHRDPAFRDLARQDPHAALRSAGIAVPYGVHVAVVADAADAVEHCLDGAQPTVADAMLDDALLEAVSGGAGQPEPGAVQTFLDTLKGSFPG